MKKFFITAIVLIVTALAMPAAGAFAADKPLEAIPARGYTQSSKAYCLYEENDGEYTLTYINSNGTKQLYKSKKEFKHHESISEDGKTVFYSIDNTVYRYSYESGKRKKIYTAQKNENSYDTHVHQRSSPSGEYCFICVEHPTGYNNYNIDLVIWHDGKTVSQTEETNFGSYGGDTYFGVNDKGEFFYTLDRDIYILDFDGKRLVEKAPELSSEEDYKYGYETKVFKESGTYFIKSENAAFYGEIGGERHTFSITDDCDVLRRNGESFIAYNGEYVARYDMKSGKSKNILKISPKKYLEKRIDFLDYSGDLDNVVYINYSKKKLVRLTGWDAAKNRYTNKQEIDLNGTGYERIEHCSYDLSIVEIMYASQENRYYIADFNSGNYVPIKDGSVDYIDRFDNIISETGGNIEIIDLDGNKTTVFKGIEIFCQPYVSNGFYIFDSGGPENRYYEAGDYELTYYYIDKNGKAVEWYKCTEYFGDDDDIEY